MKTKCNSVREWALKKPFHTLLHLVFKIYRMKNFTFFWWQYGQHRDFPPKLHQVGDNYKW